MANLPVTRFRKGLAALLLSVAVFLIYSNTFNANWQFDDLPNITLNPHLHLERLDLQSIVRAMHASPYEMRYEGQTLYRPVAALSLALNWYVGRDEVFGYHLVNCLVHLATAILLYLASIEILQAPNLPRRGADRTHHIALLAALLWAMHPIQTQAVTYIVQRMAAMAALFTVGGIFFYVRFRRQNRRGWRHLNLVGCLLCYFLGVGSKENAALLPLSLALIEIFFYQNLADKKRFRTILATTIGLGLGVFSLGVILFYVFHGNPVEYISQLYDRRPFSLGERLMTEARVIFKYLSLIFWPSIERLSLVHSIPLSTSLWSPWTTFPSIVGIAGLVAASFAGFRKYPLFSFGILFFLLNHVVESTFIPLEIVFEHRNYLPSMFLMLPVAAAIEAGLFKIQALGKWVGAAATIGVVALFMGLGIGTYLRNMVWATHTTLWQDVLRKAPNNPRPYQVLADHYKAENRIDYAMALLNKSIELHEEGPVESLALSLNNLGNLYVDIGDYGTARSYFQQAVRVYPKHEIARYNLIFVHIRRGDYQLALKEVDNLLNLNPRHNKYLNVKGFILYKLKDYTGAAEQFRRALQFSPGYRDSLINLGMTFNRMGLHEKGDWFLRRAQAMAPRDEVIMLCRIENALHGGNAKIVAMNIDMLMQTLPFGQLLELLGNREPNTLLPYDKKDVMPSVRKRLEHLLHQAN